MKNIVRLKLEDSSGIIERKQDPADLPAGEEEITIFDMLEDDERKIDEAFVRR